MNKNDKYIVISPFRDGEDQEYKYEIGDFFPRDDRKVTKKRIEELTTTKNLKGQILIKKISLEENKEESAEENKEELAGESTEENKEESAEESNKNNK